MIFKDLAVPAVSVKLTLSQLRKLVCPSCGHVLLILGSGGKLCFGSQTPPTLHIHSMLPFCSLVYMHQSIVYDYSLHSSQFCSLLELYNYLVSIKLMLVGGSYQ